MCKSSIYHKCIFQHLTDKYPGACLFLGWAYPAQADPCQLAETSQQQQRATGGIQAKLQTSPPRALTPMPVRCPSQTTQELQGLPESCHHPATKWNRTTSLAFWEVLHQNSWTRVHFTCCPLEKEIWSQICLVQNGDRLKKLHWGHQVGTLLQRCLND